jgi:hypothetical protein
VRLNFTSITGSFDDKLETINYKEYMMDCVKFWTIRSSIKSYVYNTWSAYWDRRVHEAQQVTIIKNFQGDKFNFFIPKENLESFITVLEFLEKAVQNISTE